MVSLDLLTSVKLGSRMLTQFGLNEEILDGADDVCRLVSRLQCSLECSVLKTCQVIA